VTHCGWNSTLKSLNSGLLMIAWPRFGDQFYNENLLVDVLKIDVSVGAKENKLRTSTESEDVVVKREEIAMAIKEGGHSYNDLIEDLI
jgi:UDP:flavonoid glycosyltransferase YjiC (YdhE family)